MYSTRELLNALKKANPEKRVTQDRIRNALRRGEIPAPTLFAGRFLWTPSIIKALVDYLGLKIPSFCSSKEINNELVAQ